MLKSRGILQTFCRYKHGKNHWSRLENKIYTKDRAMANFDDFYKNVFGNRWNSMRVALLCEHKYVAMINNFGDVEKTAAMLERDGAMNIRDVYNISKKNQELKGGPVIPKRAKIVKEVSEFIDQQKEIEINELYGEKERYHTSDLKTSSKTKEIDYKKPLSKVIEENSEIDCNRVVNPDFGNAGLQEFVPATKIKGMEDWLLESDHYQYYSNTADFPLKIEMVQEFKVPENLQLFTYEKGNISSFRTPSRCSTGVFSHFLMDGASILPPLALDIQPNDYVFDACAAPGGKSLLMIQSHLPKVLISNDSSLGRCNRLTKLMNQFIYEFGENKSKHRCVIRNEDARITSEFGSYDKVLVDVPCTTDRHSVNVDDNNIFKTGRIKERLRLPELQSAILTNCIKLLKPGGSIVYSTCSLSPVQNDGVVHMALSNVFKDHGITMTINDLSLVMQPFFSIMKFENPKGLKYGQMVIPFLPANFGPMYFCKMTRNV
ncbi:CLUMA_CG000001, isoform A [Clunio marinus]|uniref:NOL1/NOP2/Sun domain family member 4 n=1 Tax=Clunio marinus TaxID=568069 RepID=A0A1J1HES6_9DIPT|nr:CLUMA_CG000001, isoform A [Clunio marinus]